MPVRFSIVVPVYNAAQYLRECLDSVRKQTLSDWEIICVDDGSCDESGLILDEYSRMDPRVKVVHQKNSGVVSARSVGLSKCSGEYVWFVDADDVVDDKALEIFSDAILSCSPDIVHFGFRQRFAGKDIEILQDKRLGFRRVDEFLESVDETPLELMGMCIGDKIYRKDCVSRAMAYVCNVKIGHGEDGLMALACLLMSERYLSMENVLYTYRINPGSAVSRFYRSAPADKVWMIRCMRDLYLSSRYYKEQSCRKMLAFHAFESVCYIIMMVYKNPLVTLHEAFSVLKELSKTDLMEIAKSRVHSMKRKIPIFLARHPCVAISGLVIYRVFR